MLILPPKYQPKVLMPVPQRWRAPSRAQPKDQFGNENQTVFRLTARLDDGHVRWRGWFRDRDDADAFLTALLRHQLLGLPVPRPLWELPSPAWHPDLGEGVTYEFATQVFLFSSTGSNQTYTSPSDWTLGSVIYTLGGGASGAVSTGANSKLNHVTGGSGGALNWIFGFTFAVPGTTTATYQIGATAAGVTAGPTTQSLTGNDGNPTWFNGATFGAASVASVGGDKGNFLVTAGTIAGSVGGLKSDGIGADGRDGGASGSSTGNGAATGGGGAPSVDGNGVASATVNVSGSTHDASDGGNGGPNSHATGGAKANGGPGSAASPGGNGDNWGGSGAKGPGAGGGGAISSGNSGTCTGGAGGSYGAGSGGSAIYSTGAGGTAITLAGAQGLIVLVYGLPLGFPFRSSNINHIRAR